MNGADPPDRSRPLDLSTLQGRARAQTPCQPLIMRQSRVGLIHLQCIYNFLLFMRIYYHSWMFYHHFIATLYHFWD